MSKAKLINSNNSIQQRGMAKIHQIIRSKTKELEHCMDSIQQHKTLSLWNGTGGTPL